MNDLPIVMTEDFWCDQFSLARYYGEIIWNGVEFIIVNKEGKDIFECSEEAEKAGRTNAIEPGEPCDLVQKDWVPVYRAVGRDRFMQIVEETDGDLAKARDLAGIKTTKRKTTKRKKQ